MKVTRTLWGAEGYMILSLVLFFVAFSLSTVSYNLLFSESGLRRSGIYRNKVQAMLVADAGIQHGVEAIKSTDFTSLLCALPPCALIPSTTYPSVAGFAYTVTISNDADGGGNTEDKNNTVILGSTAFGPNGAQRTVQAYVTRSAGGFTPPGAIYVSGNSLVTTPTGIDFFITGTDTNFDGSAGPKPAIPGMSANTASVRDSFINSLTSSQKSRVQGLGYSAGSPAVPSAATTSQPVDVGLMAQKFYNKISAATTCPPLCLGGYTVVNKSDTLGTTASPQITYVQEGNQHIHFDGTVTGAGVLVTVGRTHLMSDFTFRGLVIAISKKDNETRDTELLNFRMQDRAKISGGVLIGPESSKNWIVGLDLNHQVAVYYSSQDLAMAYSVCPECFPPAVAKLIAWHGR